MLPTTLEDRVKVLADNILQGGYSHAQLVAIVTSFVKAFTNHEAVEKLSKVQDIVADSKALVRLAASDLAQKMGAKDPTLKDMQTILDMLSKLEFSAATQGAKK